jgi:hypothetical protein
MCVRLIRNSHLSGKIKSFSRLSKCIRRKYLDNKLRIVGRSEIATAVLLKI